MSEGMEMNLASLGLEETIKRVWEKGYIIGYRITDKSVAEVGAAGRLAVDALYRKKLNVGQYQMKWKKNSGGYVWAQFSRVDSNRGVVSTTRESGTRGPFKMSNFSFEVGHKRSQYNPDRPITFHAFSQARFTSQLANLWEKPTKSYSKNSPFFMTEGNDRVGFWPKGSHRKGLGLWSSAASAVRAVVPQALAEVERKFEKELAK